jgi:hypothetical protein
MPIGGTIHPIKRSAQVKDKERVMNAKDVLGLLLGGVLLLSLAVYIIHIFFHTEKFGWLLLPRTDQNPDRSSSPPAR